MKKLIVGINAVFVYYLLAMIVFVQPAAAGNVNSLDPCAAANIKPGFQKSLCALGSDVGKTIGNIVVAIVVLAVIIALAYLLFGAIKWITSGGDKEKVEAARNHIVAAIIGLIVIFLAIFIVTLVLSLLGLGLGNIVVPDITL